MDGGSPGAGGGGRRTYDLPLQPHGALTLQRQRRASVNGGETRGSEGGDKEIGSSDEGCGVGYSWEPLVTGQLSSC